MGHITRRLTYLVASRRISLPSQFLALHRLEPGVTLHLAAPDTRTRLLYTASQWSALEATARIAFPDTTIGTWLDDASTVTLGSQARVVFPAALAFPCEDARLELSWELIGGILQLRPSGSGIDGRIDVSPQPGIRAPVLHTSASEKGPVPSPAHRASDVDPQASTPLQAPLLPDGLTLPGPVQDVRLEKILGYAPDVDPDDYSRELAEDIAEQGLLRPVVLFGNAPYRVLDGRRRLQVAQALKLDSVPALVLSPLSRDDQARLRYLLETTSDRWATARQLRVMARLHVNGASLESLSRLLRKKRRTVQRYLRIAQDPRLVDAIERGDVSLLEAERQAGRVLEQR